MSRQFSVKLVALSIAVAAIAGCDSQKVTEAVNSTVDQAKTTVANTVETARQEVNLAGSMELSTSPPVAAKACYGRIIILDGDRPNVLQLASYKDAEQERFPSMFLQAPVEVSSISELAGKTVKATLFAKAGKDEGVWQTRSGAPASIVVSAVDATSMTCQCTGATLVNLKSGEQATVSGKFVAIFE